MSAGRPLWWDTAGPPPPRRPPLPGDAQVDVAVVGAGYTGLWTAYELRRRDPSLRVVVLEAEHVGYGASGRNGGWCSALLPMSLSAVAARHGGAPAAALQRAMHDTVAEIESVCAAEGIDAQLARGGYLRLARNGPQLVRLRAEVDEARRFGFGSDDLALLGAGEARARVEAAGVVGAAFTPHCAALHPMRLVLGLAAAAERRGVVIHERTRALAVEPGRVVTAAGTVRAEVVVRATEAFTVSLRRQRRAVLPITSSMIATEPLPAAFWERVGWARRETVNDARHLLVYAQRTADDRIAFGGRGAPYHFGSRIPVALDPHPGMAEALRRALVELFPDAGGAAVTHRWSGALAAPRDFWCSVRFDRRSGMGAAGGYVGDGVATSNLAGRILADLVTGADTPITRLPIVGHRSPRWEPEPLRWVGVNLVRHVAASADRSEARTGRVPRRRVAVLHRLLGG